MDRSMDAIRRVVAAFERSDWTEIDVRSGDVRVHLSAGPTDRRAGAGNGASQVDAREAVAAPDPHPSADELPQTPAGAQLVRSPSPGIFWRSPEPGAPHFVDVGDRVEPTSTLCIVEVMKLMNHVKGGVAGEIVAVYGENGVAVAKGAPLFAIVPVEPA